MKVNPLIVFRQEFDGSALLFNPENGDTFGLNRTAAFIWQALEHESPPEQILVELARVSTPPASAAADLNVFLTELRRQGYLAE